MTSSIYSIWCGGEGPRQPEAGIKINLFDNTKNGLSPCQAYESVRLMDQAKGGSDVIIYIHDDVEIYDPSWRTSVMSLFDNPNCVAVGLGGATSLGRPDLYRKPFDIWNMARGGYCSNQRDAEVHGGRFAGVKRVAVLDAFFMAVRSSFLRSVGGWPVGSLTHHCLDLWLACETAREGKEMWMVGCDCNHYGGRSSTAPAYAKAAWLQGGSMEQDHIQPHRWIYENYRDVLPITI